MAYPPIRCPRRPALAIIILVLGLVNPLVTSTPSTLRFHLCFCGQEVRQDLSIIWREWPQLASSPSGLSSANKRPGPRFVGFFQHAENHTRNKARIQERRAAQVAADRHHGHEADYEESALENK